MEINKNPDLLSNVSLTSVFGFMINHDFKSVHKTFNKHARTHKHLPIYMCEKMVTITAVLTESTPAAATINIMGFTLLLKIPQVRMNATQKNLCFLCCLPWKCLASKGRE